MEHAGSQLPWSEEQWTKVQSAVTEAFTRASVAGAFLPCFEPGTNTAEAIKVDRFVIAAAAGAIPQAAINDQATLPLFTLTVNVAISNQQVQDPALASALFAFRRAATLLAQAEDFIVLSGFGTIANRDRRVGVSPGETYRDAPLDVDIRGGPPDSWGLIEYGELSTPVARQAATARGPNVRRPAPPALSQDRPSAVPRAANDRPSPLWPLNKGYAGNRGAQVSRRESPSQLSKRLITEIGTGINTLEALGYPGPYACVVGTEIFTELQVSGPNSLVLPADRVRALLSGPLLRSGQMPQNHGVVVSLASEVVDLIVATAPRVQFLQTTNDGRLLFRAYERFVLRIKEAAPGTSRARASAYTFCLN